MRRLLLLILTTLSLSVLGQDPETFNSLISDGGFLQAFKARVIADGGTFEADACLAGEIAEIKANYNRFNIIFTPNAFKANKIF